MPERGGPQEPPRQGALPPRARGGPGTQPAAAAGVAGRLPNPTLHRISSRKGPLPLSTHRHHQTELGRLLHPGKGARSDRRGVQFAGLPLQPAAEHCYWKGPVPLPNARRSGAAAAAEGTFFTWNWARLGVRRSIYDPRGGTVRPFYGDTRSKASSAKFCLVWAGAFARPPVARNTIS